MSQEKKSWKIPASVGIAAVWFGTHVGPGTASGKQVTIYYSTYGKLGIFLPILAMGMLGIAIYYALEFARKHDLHDFRSFTDHFFHPHHRLFSLFFEITFIFTCLIVPGACIAGAATILSMHFGLSVWIGTILTILLTLVLTIYGTELVKSASTALTVGILVTIGTIVFLGIKEGAADFAAHWESRPFIDGTLWGGIWSALTYAGFQATGNLGNAISVSKGLKTRGDSLKAASLGGVLNILFLMAIVVTVYGYQPGALASDLPNYYVVQQIGRPILGIAYVALVVFASVSTIIGFGSGLIARYGRFIKIENETRRNLLLLSGMLILNVVVSSFGLTAIVNVGFRYLGLLSLPLVLIPFLVVGFHRQRKESAKESLN